jgi:hypothetical protein
MSALMVISQIKPDAPVVRSLAEEFQHFVRSQPEWRVRYPEEFVHLCVLGSPENMLQITSKLLTHPLKNLEYIYTTMSRALVTRVAHDERLGELLWSRLTETKSPSEQCTLAATLSAASGLTPRLRAWAEQQIHSESVKTDLSRVGTDLIGGQVRPVWQVCMDLLIRAEWFQTVAP